MRRSALAAAFACLLIPAGAAAQITLMGGAGLSTPLMDLSDAAEVGWHATAGIHLGVAAFPVGLRADGTYQGFGESSSEPKLSVLSGTLSAVYTLPGLGVVPYFLAGIGRHRVSVDGSDPVGRGGYHGGFGVNLGGNLPPGFFAEARFTSVDSPFPGNFRYVTATVGFRL